MAEQLQPTASPTKPLRTLVVFAYYGESHRQFLLEIIRRFRAMPRLQVDVVVVSEAPKDLGPDVEVVVGLPLPNPWSLPFAHQPILAARVEHYDLFVYSEDDIGVTETAIDAFLAATPHLAEDEIAGFLRYEIDDQGNKRLNEPWGGYHWLPGSARRRGPYVVAEFSNEHTGFYVVTQAQLRRAVQSGGLAQGPRTGRYSWPETAATDIYTSCGFKKVYCITHVEDFLVHHMPQKYWRRNDTLAAFQQQIRVMLAILDGGHPATTLCTVESPQLPLFWPKSYYEEAVPEVLDAIPTAARRVLSVGSGRGALELALRDRGSLVTALPLDSVIGGALAREGITMVYGELHTALATQPRQAFDCVVLSNLLHLQEHPQAIVRACAELVAPGGTLVVVGQNLDRLAIRIHRLRRRQGLERLRSFADSGFSRVGPRVLGRVLGDLGFTAVGTRWFDPDRLGRKLAALRPLLGGLVANQWLLTGRRPAT